MNTDIDKIHPPTYTRHLYLRLHQIYNNCHTGNQYRLINATHDLAILTSQEIYRQLGPPYYRSSNIGDRNKDTKPRQCFGGDTLGMQCRGQNFLWKYLKIENQFLKSGFRDRVS